MMTMMMMMMITIGTLFRLRQPAQHKDNYSSKTQLIVLMLMMTMMTMILCCCCCCPQPNTADVTYSSVGMQTIAVHVGNESPAITPGTAGHR